MAKKIQKKLWLPRVPVPKPGRVHVTRKDKVGRFAKHKKAIDANA